MSNNPIIEKIKNEGRTVLTEVESKTVLEQAGIPVVMTRLAANKEEVRSYAGELGFPLVMKIISPEIIHKSDIGGVKTNLTSVPEAENAYDEVMQNAKKHHPNAVIYGVSVQKMASPGLEIIVGMSKDQQFGPMLMFGLGGIMVEALKDVSFRFVPVTSRDAREMIREIKGYPLLTGFRNSSAVDIHCLENLLLGVSNLIETSPDIGELDLNPVLAYKDSVLVVDSRIVLE